MNIPFLNDTKRKTFPSMNNNLNKGLLIISAFILCMLFLTPAAFSADPAPMSKQLHIGQLTYYSTVWSNDAWRDWFAERYSWTMFDLNFFDSTNFRNDLATMKSINPSFLAYVYGFHYMYANKYNEGCAPRYWDTTDVRAWATANNVNFDSLFVRTGSGSGDSVTCQLSTSIPSITTKPNAIVTVNWGTERACWDFRNPMVGAALAAKFISRTSVFNADGVMMDEGFTVGYTGNWDWYVVPQAPFRAENYWSFPATNPFQNWQHPWDAGMSIYDIRDSLKELRSGWMQVLHDSLAAHGLSYAPNWSEVGGPHATSASGTPQPNWDNEVREATVNYTKEILMGEFCGFYPSRYQYRTHNCERSIDALIEACRGVRDSSVVLHIWPISIGPVDSAAVPNDSMTWARSRMNALGLMINCLFPGNSTYKFGPHCWPDGGAGSGNMFMANHYIGGVTVDDTTVDWSHAWGKYYGRPTTIRDSSATGYDGAGQSYTIRRLAMLYPDTDDTLTFAIGRYARGNNMKPRTTAVSANLPAGTWYELFEDGSWQLHSYDTVYVSNANWRIFSSNVNLSENGPDASGDTIPPADVIDIGRIPFMEQTGKVTFAVINKE